MKAIITTGRDWEREGGREEEKETRERKTRERKKERVLCKQPLRYNTGPVKGNYQDTIQ